MHGRLTSDDATSRVVELCRDVPWLAVALPGPGAVGRIVRMVTGE